MRAFVVTKYKEPLQEADVPEPVVGEHDVLVRVGAAGLKPLDEGIRAGGFKQILQYRLPLILGNDIAGTVIRSARRYAGSSPATRCTPGPTRTVSVRSRSVSPLPRPTWLSSPRRSAWRRRARCRWWR
jgi:NADPH:quinone reductase-like Zn-dependent oxidoreductase